MRNLLIIAIGLLMVSCVSTAGNRFTPNKMVPGGVNVYVEFEDIRPEAPLIQADVSSGPLLYQSTEVKLSQTVSDYVKESFEGFLVEKGIGIAPSAATADSIVQGKVTKFAPKLGVWYWYGDVAIEVSVDAGDPVKASGQGKATNWGMGDTAEYACDALDEALNECCAKLEDHLNKYIKSPSSD